MDKVLTVRFFPAQLSPAEILGELENVRQWTMASGTHPSVVKVLDYVSADSVHSSFFVLEDMALFHTLQDLVPWTYGFALAPIPERVARYIFREMVSAIQELHNKKITHHDLRLNSWALNDDGVVRLMDFGLNEPLRHADRHTVSEREQMAYIAPEFSDVSGII